MQGLTHLSLLGAFVWATSGVALAAPFVIDNADDFSATWSVSGTAVSATVGAGESGNGRVLTYDPNGATGNYATLSTAVTGNLSSYSAGTIELDYRTIGKDTGGTWTPTNGYPRFLRIDVVGGATTQRSIIFEAFLWTNNSGLGWDLNQDWHSIVLQLPVYDTNATEMRNAVRSGSTFDGVAPTATTLPTIAFSAVGSAADLADLWSNVTAVRIGVYTHLGTAGGVDTAAVSLDNLTLVPEPASLALVGCAGLLLNRRRQAKC